jgi:hypothetical protein
MDFSFGLETAIQTLRPGAKYTLEGTNFKDWQHELPPPNWEEVMKLVESQIRNFGNTK